MSTKLEGEVAVVTGASRGVGLEIAAALAECGARVASVARGASPVGLAVQADVSKPKDVERVKAEVESQLGTVSILVNAAGIFGPIELIKDSDPERWVETVMIDVIGPYLTCRAFVGGMIERGWGRIVNVSSAASLHPPRAMVSAYTTAKVALNQLTRHLAAELAGTGVSANVIHPGEVRTEMWADIRDQVAARGPEADSIRKWVEWVEETEGDPPRKAAELVLRIIRDNVNGRFLWIEDPLQPPRPSWDEAEPPPEWLK